MATSISSSSTSLPVLLLLSLLLLPLIFHSQPALAQNSTCGPNCTEGFGISSFFLDSPQGVSHRQILLLCRIRDLCLGCPNWNSWNCNRDPDSGECLPECCTPGDPCESCDTAHDLACPHCSNFECEVTGPGLCSFVCCNATTSSNCEATVEDGIPAAPPSAAVSFVCLAIAAVLYVLAGLVFCAYKKSSDMDPFSMEFLALSTGVRRKDGTKTGFTRYLGEHHIVASLVAIATPSTPRPERQTAMVKVLWSVFFTFSVTVVIAAVNTTLYTAMCHMSYANALILTAYADGGTLSYNAQMSVVVSIISTIGGIGANLLMSQTNKVRSWHSAAQAFLVVASVSSLIAAVVYRAEATESRFLSGEMGVYFSVFLGAMVVDWLINENIVNSLRYLLGSWADNKSMTSKKSAPTSTTPLLAPVDGK